MTDEGSPLVRIHEQDNVVVIARSLPKGTALRIDGKEIVLKEALGLGHKLAAREISKGEKVLKYGLPIGTATRDIAAGEHVHLHNLASDYLPTYTHQDGMRYGENRENRESRGHRENAHRENVSRENKVRAP